MSKFIKIIEARQNNLKNINLSIPRNKLVVICGPSGSGKSTLAFDIVYAEGQRRYIESISAYARQFLPKLDKPKVKKIEGLSPSIAIEQHSLSKNPRSTIGTTTEIYDFLRVFFARLGIPHCPQCGKPIVPQSSDQILDQILKLPEGTKFFLLSPLKENQKGSFKDLFIRLKKQGFVRIRLDNNVYTLDNPPVLDKNKKHTLELIVDRLIKKKSIAKRLADSLELALKMGEGRVKLFLVDENKSIYFSTQSHCPECKISLPNITPQLFSFNSPQGACPRCSGLGSVDYFEPHLIIPNENLSLKEGAILAWRKSKLLTKYKDIILSIGKKYKFDLDTSLNQFSPQAKQVLLYGDSNWPGVINIVEQLYQKDFYWHQQLKIFLNSHTCPECKGSRLKKEALSVKINDLNIFDITNLSIENLFSFLQNLNFSQEQEKIALPLLEEILSRLSFLKNVGLNYLSLARTMSSLSGGEAQRIRLASQLGTGLVGVTYVLDEPTIGLHPQDNQKLIQTLKELQKKGNSVLVVEHDQETILTADHIIELGPGSGEHGGEVVFQGNPQELLQSNTLTARYLKKELSIETYYSKRKPQNFITLKNVSTNNLKNINCSFPLGLLTVVTGVSGSGKSSLVVDTLYKHLAILKGEKVNNPGKVEKIIGAEQVDKVLVIDQTPIGRTPRSNPATYTQVFDEIRKIFANTLEAKKKGYTPARFSFNLKGGRCEACAGEGQIKVEMHFLPDVYITCEVCKGKRYNRETLDIFYKGLNIHDVLNLTVEEAKKIFSNHQSLVNKLNLLEEVGLDYLRLGQPATTLSGGEAQRIKLARELSKKTLPRTLYILDEPTTGLHIHEVGKLIKVLHKLVEKGATVILIEHNLDVIKCEDNIIDLGPGGGEFGGEIMATGSPAEIKNNPNSLTARFL